MTRTIAVLAPHPDDEVLGAGGTITRMASQGHRVHVVVATRGRPPMFQEDAEAALRQEALDAHRRLGVHATHWLDMPAAELDTLAHRDLNHSVGAALHDIAPDEVYVPFLGDIHRDHQLLFEAALVAVRPHHRRSPCAVYAYETLSETNWNAPFLTPGFHPTHFVEISDHLEAKLDALRCFRSQLRASPHERSIEAVRALALLRGATVAVPAAEAFVTIRSVVYGPSRAPTVPLATEG
jgi:LmbE family N-acetylglucosaminyl deacetylase